MGLSDRTYVIFDGDKDTWAYGYMKGWDSNERVNFDFVDAHDLGTMTARAENEQYVKSELRKRMSKSKQIIVLVGENTKNLYKFVRWEIELAIDLDLPIIVVNLNDKRSMDEDRCPPLLRSHFAVHIPFKLAAITYALTNFPAEHAGRNRQEKGPRVYNSSQYATVGL